jgi:hypothetical protein
VSLPGCPAEEDPGSLQLTSGPQNIPQIVQRLLIIRLWEKEKILKSKKIILHYFVFNRRIISVHEVF